jgi:hypothetical protein
LEQSQQQHGEHLDLGAVAQSGANASVGPQQATTWAYRCARIPRSSPATL